MNNIFQSQTLCKACGLCCSGHLFSWVRLNANELDKVENLGLKVIRNDPRQRGFLQPCPVWQNGICTVYKSPDYPSSCRKYKCVVLRKLLDDEIDFPNAMNQIEETLNLIREIEGLLPKSPAIGFREQLLDFVSGLYPGLADESELLRKVTQLLGWYERRFGVDDFVDYEI
ncbi:MAG: hypothetical protein IT310_15055 [Anaerolineales bacterium]|nr:hypothetical protein [Anaerolineales bacterium]